MKIDVDSTCSLRNYLDHKHGASIPIIYQLAISYRAFRDRSQREQIIKTLRVPSYSALWLLVDGFGSDSPITKVRNFIVAANDFHELGIPVVADHVGVVVGLALLAFGAIGGIAHGVTLNERFAGSALKRLPTPSDGFGPAKRVNFPAIDSMLKVEDAKALLESSRQARAHFGCRDTDCCPRGIGDMLGFPERHFLYQRVQQIAELSQIPETLRPLRFLDQHLRPASDKAVSAANIEFQSKKLGNKLQLNRKRLDSLRTGLGEYAEKTPPRSFAPHPQTRVTREVRR